ncbi:F0F1 ATP synthase subunit delta [Shewanella sp. AS16]|uniref:F0F1 ATP synthase subunit delta n=1 Tax=Shewanella sp. AS16 TaxID=2907625 RepID=UPI001F2FC7B5|nr:F0F1 ATP synthase subunit delta [Shewanella sp. AS16]MCE9684799.1 F0F1 ATP synthase subunit delta [Shewanella sp. AS16]
MSLDPITFGLEVLNFLVLLWILHHFLYRPIQAAIAKRQQQLTQAQQAATLREQQAAALVQQYRQQLQLWDSEQAERRSALQQALQQEKQLAMTQVQQAADTERTRLQTLMQQDSAKLRKTLEQQGAQAALALCAELLQRLAGSALDQALLDMLLADLHQLPAAEQQALRTAFGQLQGPVAVSCAHTLTPAQQQSLTQALTALLGQACTPELHIDAGLIGGFRIDIGAQVLHANLRDELAFFRSGLSHVGH